MKAPRSIASHIILGILLFYVCLLSAIVPWTGDDIKYLFSFADGTVISSLEDAWVSQLAHWQIANGRFLAHFLVQVILGITGRTVFVVLNGLAYVALISLVLNLSGRSFKDLKSTLAVCVLVLLAMPTKYVPTCQVGYVWMFDIVLFFVVKWKRIVMEKNGVSRLNLLWLIPLAFLAGFSQEAIVIGVGFALLVYSVKNIKTLDVFGWSMLASFGIGAMLLCLSPGNFGRAAEVHGEIVGLDARALSVVKFLLYQRVSYVMLLLVIYLVVKHKVKFIDICKCAPLLWQAWAILLIFNLLIGVFGNRQLFGAEIIAVIITMKLISGFLPKGLMIPQVMVSVATFALLSFNVYSAFHARRVYDTIVEEYHNSSDGTVSHRLGFFDRHYRESGPADAWSWFVTSTVDMLLKQEPGNEEKTLRIFSNDDNN